MNLEKYKAFINEQKKFFDENIQKTLNGHGMTLNGPEEKLVLGGCFHEVEKQDFPFRQGKD